MPAGARRGTIRIVPILLLLAAAVILAGVVSVAMGHGGEMAEFAMDYLAPDLMTAADVALLRPPSAIWGYNAQVTDEALNQIAQVITERDVEIAVLRQQLAELRSATGSHPAIAATLLARSKAASTRGFSTREAGARAAGTREAEAGSPGAAADPLDPPSAEAETPDGDVPRNGAAGTTSPGPGTPHSGEAAAGRDD
jgi:hypothetical protein